MSSEKLVKLSVFVKRKPGLSHEEFFKYWTEVHAPIFMSLAIAKRNVVKYVQFQIDSDASAELGKFAPIAQFDGYAIFYAKTKEQLFELFADAEYLERAYPDEANFLDRTAALTMIGYDVDIATVAQGLG